MNLDMEDRFDVIFFKERSQEEIKAKEEELRDAISEYEELCNDNRAQSVRAKDLFKIRGELFKDLGFELCAHNAAIYGSKRYAKLKFSGIDRAITPKEYKKIINLSGNN